MQLTADGRRLPTVTLFGIYGFFGEYRYLSNYHHAPIVMTPSDIVYPTAEHAYVAQKTTDKDLQRHIASLPTPAAARTEGRGLSLRANWEALRVEIMYNVVAAKFRQHPELAEKLLATGSLYLEETNNWRDTFWGVCQGVGLNMLGKTLMQIRSELLAEIQPPYPVLGPRE